jgi:bilirubin oxidase
MALPHFLTPFVAVAVLAVQAQAQAPRLAAAPVAAEQPGRPRDLAPAVRTVEVSLSAAPARLSVTPGTVTDLFAYNGTVPGPVLEFREGDRVVVHFRNDLPVPTTVHWHGLHLPFESDGSPFHPVAPGESYDYEFDIRPGTAGTYWYHPHPNHETGKQVAHGLYGAVIVRAADDPLAGLPEQVLVLSDNRLHPDGSLDIPDPHTHAALVDRENGREGPLLLVNGRVMPELTIRSGEVQRWRVINASAGRIYRLSLPGRPFLFVGTDGGLFEKPVEVPDILVAPSERVELLVRGGSHEGSLDLVDLPYDRYIPQTKPRTWNCPRRMLTLRTTPEPLSRPAAELPPTLRPVERLDTAQVSATRVIALSQGMINGKLMDMERVDVDAPLGATEIWQVENLVGMDHPFHLHGFRFQVLDRNGVPEPFPTWKDVVNVPRHETARIIVRFDDYPGKWMFHCHILDHEDHGMMGILQVN